VAEFDQVTRRREPARPVRRPDGWDARRRIARRIDDDKRNVPGTELLLVLRCQIGEDQDHTDRPTPENARDPLGAWRVSVTALGEHNAHVVLARDVLESFDDLHRPGAVELVEDHLEEAGLPSLVAATAVSVRLEQVLDPRARDGCNIPTPVEHLRNGGQRYTSLVSDLGESDARRDLFYGHGAIVSVSSISFAVRTDSFRDAFARASIL